MKKLLIGILVICIGLFTACSQTDEDKDTKGDTVTPVEIATAEVGDLLIEKTVYGKTSAESTAPVLVGMPGEVDTLKVANGDKVTKDQQIGKVKTAAGTQTIKASRGGTIAQLSVEVGEFIPEEQPLAVIIHTDKLQFNASVTKDVRALFEKGAKLKTIIEDETYEAEITSVDMVPDETGLYPIVAKIENPDQVILPGTVAIIYVPEKRVAETVILPTAAIIEDSDGAFVYVIVDDVAKKIEVTITESQSDQTAIEGEVVAGDQVVINGQLTLSDGSKVSAPKEKEGNES